VSFARPTRLARLVTAVVAVGLVATLVGCRPTGGSSPAASGPVALTVGLGFIPSVQFAPFYYADQHGYYRDAGLTVTFQNQIDLNLITLVGQGAIDVGLADGTSVLPAVSQGIPIKYLATIYGTFPSIVFAKVSSGITGPADLRGKRIGIPGRYGSSWIMLQALLDSASLTPDDATIVEYPDFGQGAALAKGQIDAATGFANNEPVQLRLQGEKVSVMHIDDVVALPGPGFIAGTKTLDAKRPAIIAFIAATLHAMRDIVGKPDEGLDAAIVVVPDLAQDRRTQAAILQATIDVWHSNGGTPETYGRIDDEGWAATLDLLRRLGVVTKPIELDNVIEDLSTPPAG
jgi:NitT/TauT family transport system substrate-binding protein